MSTRFREDAEQAFRHWGFEPNTYMQGIYVSDVIDAIARLKIQVEREEPSGVLHFLIPHDLSGRAVGQFVTAIAKLRPDEVEFFEPMSVEPPTKPFRLTAWWD